MKTTHIVIGIGAILAIGAAWLLVSKKSSDSDSVPDLTPIKESLKAQYDASGKTVTPLRLYSATFKEFNRIQSGK